MGSCLSAESRSSIPDSPDSALGYGRSRSSRKRLGSRSSSFDHQREEKLHRIPGRFFLNGASDIASLFTQQGKKGTNQDAMIVWQDFGSRTDTVFCGVFDGHGPFGHMVAKRVRDSLPLKLSTQWDVNIHSEKVLKEVNLNTTGSMNSEDTAFMSADVESRSSIDNEGIEKEPDVFQTLKELFLKTFKVMDKELKMQRNIDCFCSGTTAVTLIKQGRDLVIGNVGDSRAVLATRDKEDSLLAVQLTLDLKPNLPGELERIRKCRGRVFALPDEPEVARVWLPHNDAPGLAMARAFGDFCLKDYGLISVPDVSYRQLTDRDEFIVMATDGVWDVLSNEEVVNIVALSPARSGAARALVESAVRAWKLKYPTSKIDDCAVVCLFLDSNLSVSHSKELKEGGGLSSTQQVHGGSTEEATSAPALAELPRSGTTVRTAGDVFWEASRHEEASLLEDEPMDSEMEWSALEGVSRVNTFLNMPRFAPPEKDKKTATAAGTKAFFK